MRGVELDQSVPLLLEAGPSSGPPSHGAENPVSMLRRQLRGRWKLVTVCSAVFATLGAVGGYFSTKPQFTSTGIVDIKPTLPVILFKNEENSMPPMFESMVKAQAAYLNNARVLDRAVNDPALKEAGWPSGGEGVSQLQDSLKVGTEKGSQIITVRVTDDKPQTAARAVNAVLKAYREIYGELGGVQATAKERALENRAQSQRAELESLKNDLLRQRDSFGPDVQNKAFESRVGDLDRITQQIQDVELAIAQKEARMHKDAAGAAAKEEAAGDAPPIPDEDLYASSDEGLARLIVERNQARAAMAANSVRYGKKHVVMRNLQAQIDTKQHEIDDRVGQLKKSGAVPGFAAAGAMGGGRANQAQLIDRPMDELKALGAQLLAIKEKLGRDIQEIDKKRMVLSTREEQMADLKQKLEKTEQALEEIKTEKRNTETGRVTTQDGDVPFKPSSDKQVMRAVAGLVAGIGGGIGLVLLLGLVRGNYRYIEDLEQGVQAPLLGTLPELTTGDGEHDELAAGSVHHVRNMLQLQHTRRLNEDGARVYAITSASAGEGKTSLSLALGMSFAAAGHRTLLIDADLYGRGLTKSLGLRGVDGLSEAALARDLNGEVHETGFPSVWAIPAGRSEGFDAQNLSKPRMQALLDKVRGEFDIVIVDTGPLLGSIEANLGAALADGVVLMVTRGQDSKLVRACLKRIRSVGGMCAGMVFNRAIRQDFERSVSSNSFRSTAPRLQGATDNSPSKDSSLLRALGAGGKDEASDRS